jgi:TonB family protein
MRAVWRSVRAGQTGRLSLVAVVLVCSAPVPAVPGQSWRLGVLAGQGNVDVRSTLSAALAGNGSFVIAPLEQTAAAASALGHTGSLSAPRGAWVRLGQASGVDMLVGTAGWLLERRPYEGAAYWDACIAAVLVDARSGALRTWVSIARRGDRADDAWKLAVAALSDALAGWAEHAAAPPTALTPLGDGVLDLVMNPQSPGVRPPRFFKRPKPEYTSAADAARVEATVELVVVFNADGTYGPIDVVRWAGFGLDEAAVAAVRSRHFVPATAGGRPVPARALLRFDFTSPREP